MGRDLTECTGEASASRAAANCCCRVGDSNHLLLSAINPHDSARSCIQLLTQLLWPYLQLLMLSPALSSLESRRCRRLHRLWGAPQLRPRGRWGKGCLLGIERKRPAGGRQHSRRGTNAHADGGKREAGGPRTRCVGA
jgi:hypothetical protein